MTTATIKFRASSVGMKEGKLYFQVIHNRVIRQIHTDYRLFSSEWNKELSAVVLPSAVTSQRYAYLLTLQNNLEADKKKLLSVIERLDKDANPYTADTVAACFRERKTQPGIIGFTLKLNERLRKIGKKRMAERYATTVNSLQRYIQGGDVPLEDVPLEEFDSTMVQGYEQWLRERGLCRNTSSFYIRNLRTIYNHAVDDGLVVFTSSPFKHVYTGIDKTVKRALTLENIKHLKALDLSKSPCMELARDMFLFSLYTRGMSFIDMAKLKKHDLKDGVLSYKRQKTMQQLHIKWEAPMQEIVDKYRNDKSPYLLPIVLGEDEKDSFWRQYQNGYSRINKHLKKLGKLLELSIPLTTYVARHSWASIAKSKNVAVSIISKGLGHDSEKTTQIYLSTLDTSAVDKANRLIINAL